MSGQHGEAGRFGSCNDARRLCAIAGDWLFDQTRPAALQGHQRMIRVKPGGSRHNCAVDGYVDVLDACKSRDIKAPATVRVRVDDTREFRTTVGKDLTCVSRSDETEASHQQPRRTVSSHRTWRSVLVSQTVEDFLGLVGAGVNVV